MLELKKTNFQLWQQTVKSGGINSTCKDDITVMVNQFAIQLFGPHILSGGLNTEEQE